MKTAMYETGFQFTYIGKPAMVIARRTSCGVTTYAVRSSLNRLVLMYEEEIMREVAITNAKQQHPDIDRN